MTLWRWFKYKEWKLPAKPMKINGHWHPVVYLLWYDWQHRAGRNWVWHAASRLYGGQCCYASAPATNRHGARRRLHRTISYLEGAGE